MIQIDLEIRPADLQRKIEHLWELSASKLLALDLAHPEAGTPAAFTVEGSYATRESGDGTQGLAYGSALLQFDAFWDESFLALGREGTLQRMTPYVTHFGSHDHGGANVSTYGQLWRLARESRLKRDAGEHALYELALKCSGAVQAQRWTHIANGEGFIHSMHGPHSLLAETLRSLRSVALAHQFGHVMLGERGEKISLLRRLVEHARTTAHWSIFYGQGRDSYDVRGRVAQESVFNVADGSFRNPATQQGYSPFTTHMRSLATVLLGNAELLEFVAHLPESDFERIGGRDAVEVVLLDAARATGDYYIDHTPIDGIPYWDSGAPGLQFLGQYLERPAEPFNTCEPVDSSAAAIAAQGLLRLGRVLSARGQLTGAERYWQAGLTVLRTLFAEPYLSTDPRHQGLLLHAVSHRPSGRDHIPSERSIPCGEASLLGDYHAREVALYVQRIYEGKPYLAFFGA